MQKTTATLWGKAEIVKDPLATIWTAVENSHNAVDSALEFEAALSAFFPSDRKYAFEERGRSTVKVYQEITAQSITSCWMIGAAQNAGFHHHHWHFWYSAWVEAGQPDLGGKVDPKDWEGIEEEKKQLEAEYRAKPVKSPEHDE